MITPILVQMTDRQWTLSALHLAFAMVRKSDPSVALVRFINVPQVQWLGTPLGSTIPTPQEYADLSDYQTAAEDYGVELTLYTMQYVTLLGAIVQASEGLNAQAVFARLEPSVIPGWHRFQISRLRRQLEHCNRQFYPLEPPDSTPSSDWTPSILVTRHTGKP